MATLIFRILLFLLPFLIFYLFIQWRKTKKDGEENKDLDKNIGTAAILGIVVLLSLMVYLGLTSEANRDLEDVPPQEVDGEIQPGYFKEKTD